MLQRLIVALLTLCCAGALPAHAGEPLRALLLTSPGIYHDYAYQTDAITAALNARLNVQFDVSLADEARWRSTDFSAGYDVLVYNICMADNTDTELIANLRRQTRELGVPAIVLHCTMHSFRKTEQWWPMYGLQTVAHEAIGEIALRQVGTHPVLRGLPAQWTLAEDELYSNLQFEAAPLLTAAGKDGTAHVVAWTHSAAGTRVFEGGTAAGVRRILAATGSNALAFIRELQDEVRRARIAAKATTGGDLAGKIDKIRESERALERKVKQLEKQLLEGGGSGDGGGGLDAMLADAKDIGELRVLGVRLPDGTNMGSLRELVEKLRDKLGEKSVVMAATKNGDKAQLAVTVSKPATKLVQAGKLIRPVAAHVGGSGGGRPDMAQAGGNDPSGIDQAVAAIYAEVQSAVG